jgi:hypothetical protein
MTVEVAEKLMFCITWIRRILRFWKCARPSVYLYFEHFCYSETYLTFG